MDPILDPLFDPFFGPLGRNHAKSALNWRILAKKGSQNGPFLGQKPVFGPLKRAISFTILS